MDDETREHYLTRRRALAMELASLDKLLGIEKPTVYCPGPLHKHDEQLLVKFFRVIRAERPPA